MKLSTIECVANHDYGISRNIPMAWLLAEARDLGWVILEDDETRALCPEHANGAVRAGGAWVVGCYSCDFEEEYDSEEDARYELAEHECEPDTYIRSPEEMARKAEKREQWNEERVERLKREQIASREASARQELLEKRAAKWLKIRNTIVFWNKEKE